MQVEQEGVTVKGSSHFNPDPDAETLYKAMKGIGEYQPRPGDWGPTCSHPQEGDSRESQASKVYPFNSE